MRKKYVKHLGYGNARHASTYTVDGVTDTLRGWADRIGCTYLTLYKRICFYGRSPEEAIRAGKKHLFRTYLTIDGQTHTIAEWGRETGLDPDLISERISRGGWSPEEAVGLKPHADRKEKQITWRGKTLNIADWARRLGITDGAMRARLRMHKRGQMSMRAVFIKGDIPPWRIFRKIKSQNWYRGRRLSIPEIAKRKGCGITLVNKWFAAGYTATQILDNPAIAPVRDTKEISRRAIESIRRNKRLRELKRLGLVL